MGKSQNWFGLIRKKLFRSTHHETIIVLHTNGTSTSFIDEETTTKSAANSEVQKYSEATLSEEDIAAMKIQAFFRVHLARKAFRALKSLVKLQAVVRGAYVRKQARTALHCMHALARLQVAVKTRQLFSKC